MRKRPPQAVSHLGNEATCRADLRLAQRRREMHGMARGTSSRRRQGGIWHGHL